MIIRGFLGFFCEFEFILDLVALQVIKYESVIHEFDPYFNYRVTQVRFSLFVDFFFLNLFVYINGLFGLRLVGEEKGTEILNTKRTMICDAVKKSYSL